MESKGLLSQIKCPQLIACSVMFKKLLLRTQGLSDVLQSKELDLAAAMDLHGRNGDRIVDEMEKTEEVLDQGVERS